MAKRGNLATIRKTLPYAQKIENDMELEGNFKQNFLCRKIISATADINELKHMKQSRHLIVTTMNPSLTDQNQTILQLQLRIVSLYRPS